MSIFSYRGNVFVHDGEPVRILSGALHYFRVVPEYWQDRLLKLKACGFNTVETYIPWNFHEPKPGLFRFDGMADVVRFIEIAGELGLLVIVRPSPYICAEWDFGGLPAWLLADSDMQLRCSHPTFLQKVDDYYDELIPRLKPLLCTNGGPIIAVQIENEYGSYGNDAKYLEHLKQGLISRGIDVLLFTSDGPTDSLLQGGSVPGALATVNFGSQPGTSFAKLKEYQPDAPLMCMEYWNGWFDHWGKPHHTRDAGDVAAVLDEMLAADVSVNFYMFHGGTNFGFYNGANCQQPDLYEPTVTSYDYDALLDEAGEPTDKYYAVREVIAKHETLSELNLPPRINCRSYGRINLTEHAGLFDHLDHLSVPFSSVTPIPMEKAGQSYGFILYTTRISGPRQMEELHLQDVRDRALVFLDGEFKAVIERSPDGQAVSFEVPAGGSRLDILVENMGRINYGPFLKDRKGITEGVRFGFQFLFDWTIRPLPLEDLSKLSYGRAMDALSQPQFYRGTLHADTCEDTFLNMDGWTKGIVFLNGFNLGRYWNKGPQRTLYVPAPLLRSGENEIVIFELHGTRDTSVNFTATPILDQLTAEPSNPTVMNNLALAKPTEAQALWQDLELGMFCHFGLNTFQNREWGDGQDSPSAFNPESLDAAQWARTAKLAGMKYLMLTAKHHDGFCLWPTATTNYSVRSSPWKDGTGDVVRECADACRKEGILFGVYLSPWDRHDSRYPDPKVYDDVYCAQLTELLTQYGPLVEIWFDGAGSEGRQYDWPRVMDLVKKYQPDAMVFNMGAPTIRWVGNEDGIAPYPCWNTAEAARKSMYTNEMTSWLSETPDWVPAECPVPIRGNHWFWHPNDPTPLRSLKELTDMYERSVGHGATLLLNLAPDHRGLLPDEEVERAIELGNEIRRKYSYPIAEMAGEGNLLTLRLPGNPNKIDRVVLMEHIRNGERIREYVLETEYEGEWTVIAVGSAVGHMKIDLFTPIRTSQIRLRVLQSAGLPLIRAFKAYEADSHEQEGE